MVEFVFSYGITHSSSDGCESTRTSKDARRAVSPGNFFRRRSCRNGGPRSCIDNIVIVITAQIEFACETTLQLDVFSHFPTAIPEP